jgi:hypothetical protein
MKDKRVLCISVSDNPNFFVKKGKKFYASIREVEAWAFADVVNETKDFEIIDNRVIIEKSYPKCLDEKEVITIKWRLNNE